MKKGLLTVCLSLFIFSGLIAGDVKVNHTVEKNADRNEYKVTSVFMGATNADFAKVSFQIPEGIKVISSSSGGSVAKKETDGISFYALSVDEKGVTTVFYVQPIDNEEISIGVKFVYAVGEEKVKPNIENLIISSSEEYVSYEGETPDDNSFVIKDLESNDGSESSASTSLGDFSIQLLSLAEYSDERVMKFCLKHKLKSGDLIKRNVNGLTKVSIGRYPSKEAANSAKKAMIEGDALLDDAFIVSLK